MRGAGTEGPPPSVGGHGRAEEAGEVYWEPLTGSGEAGRRRGRLLGGRGLGSGCGGGLVCLA